MPCRSIKGAITVKEDTPASIEESAKTLLDQMIATNNIDKTDIVSAIFSVTTDLFSAFPAKTARLHFGWDEVPMLCVQELDVPGSLRKCLRVLVTVNSTKKPEEILHIYLEGAQTLRPDIVHKAHVTELPRNDNL